MDNSPRWDRFYTRIAPYKTMEFKRLNNQIIQKPISNSPTSSMNIL